MFKTLIALMLYIVLIGTNVEAEFICSADVHYKWRRASSSENTTNGESQNEHTVYWTSIEKQAATEEAAKEMVHKVSLAERGNAERACSTTHQNLSGCIASKYSSLSSSVNSLGFAARKSIEEAIDADCKLQQGKCSGSVVSEINCRQSAEAAVQTDAEKNNKERKKR